MTLQPLGDHVLVRIAPGKERKGLIVLPEGSRVLTGVVSATGRGRWEKGKRRPLDVAVGERVAFFRENLEHRLGKELVRVLAEIDVDGAKHGLLREADILFVLGPGFDGELS